MAEAGDRIAGTVEWFSSERNYGFITGSDGESYFVHYNEIVCWPETRSHKHLRRSDEVHFLVGPRAGRGDQPQALDVEVTFSAEERKSLG